uniref:Uncharacterized protein n=1 Tax=Oryza rufipogon TaxID=4529 RepID=A0A0E0PBQ7_ORYRU
MTDDAVTGDELRRGRPRRTPGIADSGDELQRGVRHELWRMWPRRRAVWHGCPGRRTRSPATSSDAAAPDEPPASRNPATSFRLS